MSQGNGYDFQSQECPDERQLRWLRNLHEGLARDFGAALSTLLRSPVGVSLAGVDQRTYGEFIDSLDTPACFHVLKAGPLEERLLLDIEPSILYPMIDRLLGGGKGDRSNLCEAGHRPEVGRGPFRQIGPVPFSAERPLTEIELRLTARMVRLFLQEFQRAWKEVLDLKLDVLQVESNPRVLRVLPSDEAVILIAFELMIGDLRGMMRLCLPCRVLERIGDKPSPENPAPVNGPAPASLLEVAVTLAETQITADELADLRVGDIVNTETELGSPATISIEGVARFRAKPGVYQGRQAVCITEAIDDSVPAPPEPPPLA